MLERVLVVGLGSIGRRHARLARQLLPGVEIIALRHRAPADGDEPGVDRSVTTIEAALQLRPQAAVIASPATHHLETALRLADAGVHLLIEKPLAASSDGVAALVDTARERGAVLMTGYNLRFLRSLRGFRELLQSDRIGRVLSVRAEVGQYLPGWRPDSDYRDTVSAQAALGGGVLLELSHEIDYLRWLFGDVAWVSAVLTRQSALQIDVEDSAHLILGFAPRREGAPVVATVNLDFVRRDTTRSCTVIGDAGTLRWNAITGVVDVFDATSTGWQTLTEHVAQRDETYLAEWAHFLDCIAGKAQPMVSGADGLETLRVVDAARRSSSAGAIERLSPVAPSVAQLDI